ncbi:MAG: prolyl oligopeptidase family serine peptidase [Pseudomonadota bacterium]
MLKSLAHNPKRFLLYEGTPPFARASDTEVMPYADFYEAPADISTGHIMLAFPGGAYSFLSKLSSTDYGKFFAERGISVLSVNFRLGSQGYDGRAICADALAAVRLAQRLCETSGHLDSNQVGLIGTSAGGHLAGMLSTGAAEILLSSEPSAAGLPLEWRPSFALYCYAVLSLETPLRHLETAQNFLGDGVLDTTAQRAASPIKHVASDHCRSFLWHTAEDTEVALENTLDMYQALRAQGVATELHVYEKGPHALGLASDLIGDEQLHWANDAARWIVNRPIAPKTPPPSP